jgi:ribA/ribD-fused uncharacterized protein
MTEAGGTVRRLYFYSPTHENGWLANFSAHAISLNGHEWKTAEHFFQASKFLFPPLASAIREAASATEAKYLAKLWHAHKRADWGFIRLAVMYEAVRAKFTQHPNLRLQLLGTGDSMLIERAPSDCFWGQTVEGYGLNVMGAILMALRSDLRQGGPR